MAVEYAVDGRVGVFQMGDGVESILHVRPSPLYRKHADIITLQFPWSSRPPGADTALSVRRHTVVVSGQFQLQFHDDSIQNFPYGVAAAKQKSVRERQAAYGHQSLDVCTVPPHGAENPRNVAHRKVLV